VSFSNADPRIQSSRWRSLDLRPHMQRLFSPLPRVPNLHFNGRPRYFSRPLPADQSGPLAPRLHDNFRKDVGMQSPPRPSGFSSASPLSFFAPEVFSICEAFYTVRRLRRTHRPTFLGLNLTPVSLPLSSTTDNKSGLSSTCFGVQRTTHAA